jgi:predicted secreted protein
MCRSLSLLALALLALGPIACAGVSEDTDDSTADEEIARKRTIKITEADDGQEVDVRQGESFSIQLPSKASDDGGWEITSIARAVGQPDKVEKSDGLQKFTWSTKTGLEGLHDTYKIKLAYHEPSTSAAKTFSVSVYIYPTLAPAWRRHKRG